MHHRTPCGGGVLSTVTQNTLLGDYLFIVAQNRGRPHPQQPGQSAPHGQLDQQKSTRSVLEEGSPRSRGFRAAPQGSKGGSATLYPTLWGFAPVSGILGIIEVEASP